MYLFNNYPLLRLNHIPEVFSQSSEVAYYMIIPIFLGEKASLGEHITIYYILFKKLL